MTGKQKDSAESTRPKLEIVLKCDSVGSMEAVTHALSELILPDVSVTLIHRGLGAVSKSDVLLGRDGQQSHSRFSGGCAAGMGKVLKEHCVEVRLYEVIYALTNDIKAIAEGMIPSVPQEQIIGSAKVIALLRAREKGLL